MDNGVEFLSIEIPESVDLIQYLILSFIGKLNTDEQKDLLKILDEIENFKIKYGKFYKTSQDLEKNKELKQASIFVTDIVSGIFSEIVILKKLINSEEVNNIYEIRMLSENYQYRIFIFPYDKQNSYYSIPFITMTYGFDKQHLTRKKSNQITDMLRDSSQKIRNDFYSNEMNINNYIPNHAQEV